MNLSKLSFLQEQTYKLYNEAEVYKKQIKNILIGESSKTKD